MDNLFIALMISMLGSELASQITQKDQTLKTPFYITI